MSYWYYKENEGRWIAVLLVGVVVGAVAVGLAWVGAWWLSPSEPAPPQPMAAAPQSVGERAAESTETSETTSHVDRCRSVYDAQRDPLRAAADSLSQWEVHIGAMNKLVVGAITLDQARQFWNQTRTGAHARLDEFATARDHYDQRIYRCPPPAHPAAARPALKTCHAAASARGRTLRLATVTLRTWAQHVHHMDMLRAGEMTPEEATRLWLQSWREGDRELRAYQAAARKARGLTC